MSQRNTKAAESRRLDSCGRDNPEVMERRVLAGWGTIGAGGAIVLASLVGPASAQLPAPAPTVGHADAPTAAQRM